MKFIYTIQLYQGKRLKGFNSAVCMQESMCALQQGANAANGACLNVKAHEASRLGSTAADPPFYDRFCLVHQQTPTNPEDGDACA
jgi:hypothetical protein